MAKKKNNSDSGPVWGDPAMYKPSEAIVSPGQLPTGLVPSRRSGDGFLTKGNPQLGLDVTNELAKLFLGTIALGGTSALADTLGRRAILKAGTKAADLAGSSALEVGMGRLSGATGAGGRIFRTTTPMGPTLGSTSIGTTAQQSARINNLAIGAEKQAARIAELARSKAMTNKARSVQKTMSALEAAGALGILGQRYNK